MRSAMVLAQPGARATSGQNDIMLAVLAVLAVLAELAVALLRTARRRRVGAVCGKRAIARRESNKRSFNSATLAFLAYPSVLVFYFIHCAFLSFSFLQSVCCFDCA